MSRFPGWTEEAVSRIETKKLIATDKIKRKSKYRAQRAEYKGRIYDSKFEAKYAQQLDMQKLAGDIISWERQVAVNLVVNGIHIAKYVIDFLIEHKDGKKEYVEIKGFKTRDWKLKCKLFKALYPDYWYTIVEKKKGR